MVKLFPSENTRRWQRGDRAFISEHPVQLETTALERRGKSRQKPREMCGFCLPAGRNSGRADLKVDKNRGKCVIFVYRLIQNCGARP